MCKKLIFKTKRAVYALPVDSIVYMEKNLRKIRLHTKDETIEFYGKFSDVIPMLDSRFLYCHRSYVINMDEIVIMTDNGIYVSNNECILLGRDTYGKAKRIFQDYLSQK